MTLEISVPGRWCLMAACATWLGVAIGLLSVRLLPVLAVAVTLLLLSIRRRFISVAVVFVVLGLFSGALAGERLDAIHRAKLPQGHVVLVARMAEEPSGASYSKAVVDPVSVDGIPWNGPRLALAGLDPNARVGGTVTVEGVIRAQVMRVRDEIVAGVMTVDKVVLVQPSTNPIVWVGNAVRGRVAAVYDGSRSGDGLVRGLLIGDTALLYAEDDDRGDQPIGFRDKLDCKLAARQGYVEHALLEPIRARDTSCRSSPAPTHRRASGPESARPRSARRGSPAVPTEAKGPLRRRSA